MAKSHELFGDISRNGFRLTIDSDLQGPSSPGKRVSNGKIRSLIDLIGNEQYSIRVAATRKLSSLGKRPVPALLKALQNGVWYTRECAAQALGEIADVRAIEPLFSCLQDENVGVRRSAASALSRIVEKDGLAKVAGVLSQTPENDRRLILEAIRKASPLAGRKLDEISGDHGGFHKKVEEVGGDDGVPAENTSHSNSISDGAKRLLSRLWRLLQPGS